MERQLPLFAWLPIIVMLALTESEEKKQNGSELVCGVNRLKVAINSYPKESEFLWKEGYVLAVGRGKMGKCVLALKYRQTE